MSSINVKRYKAIKALLQPLLPASALAARLEEDYGISVTFRTVYNWPRRGISEPCTPAIAEMTGRSVEEVLKLSGKI